jgi:hypothetical protein
VLTVCWSNDENSVAGAPVPSGAYAVWKTLVYSLMSGQALMVLLLGEGASPSFALQCHHAWIGAPSPMHANHP